ncbi:MAG: ATP-binding protein [Elainellaceae cyanobacterium]
MPFTNPDFLITFLERLPICIHTDSVLSLLKTLEEYPCDRLLITDEQQRPLGILAAHRILPYVLAPHQSDASLLSSPKPLEGSIAEILSKSSCDQDTQPLLCPVITLPIKSSLNQAQASLQDFPNHECVLLSETNIPVGVLNRLDLWKFLATHGSDLNKAKIWSPAQQDNPSINTGNTSSAGRLADDVIQSTSQLLRHFPLPVMIQTGTGEVVSQNLAWQQQVGASQTASKLQHDMTTILMQTASTYASAPHPSLSDSVDSHTAFDTASNLNEVSPVDLNARYGEFGAADLCKPGNTSNTCICVQLMEDGREQVWKFIKVLLQISSDSMTDAHTIAEVATLSTAGSSDLAISDQWLVSSVSSSPDIPLTQDAASSSSLGQSETDFWLVLAQDATEHERIARELIAKNADLTQLNRLKDEFLACISHELKTPLTAILGLSSLLKDQQLGPLNSRQVYYAQLIHQSGRHLSLIVNNILDLTRIETGQLKLMLEPVELRGICEAAYRQAQQIYSSENISSDQDDTHVKTAPFSLDIEPGLNHLIADELRLRQMLAHLLSNAVKFTPADGEIGLSVTSWDGWMALKVWDTGIGIPADKQHLIFQKFQQLEHPLTRRFEGAGLGLVLTQRLAQLHGGDVSFTSVESQGSQFTLLLPLCPPQIKAMELAKFQSLLASTSTLSRQNHLVVVVEGSSSHLDSLTEQLTQLGYRVAIARSGTEAIGKIRRLQPVAVLMNPDLPLLSGWGVMTLLKSDVQTQHVPVVIMASPVETGSVRCNGASGFLNLPIQLEALRTTLESLTRLKSDADAHTESLSDLTVLYLNVGRTMGGNEDKSEGESGLDVSGFLESDEDNQILESGAPDLTTRCDLNHLLYPYHCRVLEVDDVDQADLLARVWNPDVILIDGSIADPKSLMQELSQNPYLVTLPIVTLTPNITQVANQIPGLAVFPCLELQDTYDNTVSPSQASALIQALRIAAGIGWAPHIALVDLADLTTHSTENCQSFEVVSVHNGMKHTDTWLSALMRYFQAAGLQCSILNAWPDIRHQLQHRSINLLILYVSSEQSMKALADTMSWLETLAITVPVFVLDGSYASHASAYIQTQQLQRTSQSSPLHIVSASVSMKELLDQIHGVLSKTMLSQ